MPKTIKSKHLLRLFPFEFLYDLNVLFLNEELQFMFDMPTFNDSLQRKEIGRLFTTNEMYMDYQARIKEKQSLYFLGDDENTTNILDVSPIGEVVTLQSVSQTKNTHTIDKTILREIDETKKENMVILCAQIYNEQDEPVLSRDVDEESIENLPEIKWDDPNLLLAVLYFGQTDEMPNHDGTTLQILKMPERMSDKWFEEKTSEPIDEAEFETIDQEVNNNSYV